VLASILASILAWTLASRREAAQNQPKSWVPPLGCVALDRALHLVEQHPQFTKIDAVRSHKLANNWIGQQLVD